MKNITEIVVLMCGGSGCCPEARFNDDGSIDIVDQDDGKNECVHLSIEQAKVLRDALNAKL